MAKKIIIIVIMTFICTSCEDVIDVDLETSEPRLVVEASINWIKNTAGNTQQIKLTKTTSYFDTSVLPVNGATVTITDDDNNTFLFTEREATGIYETQNFIPVLNKRYYLTIEYEGETYTGNEVLVPVVEIEDAEQGIAPGFSEDEIEIKAYFTDPADTENYYLYSFEVSNKYTLDVYKDEFFNGNRIFAYYSNDELEPNDEVIIHGYGISERYYNYMFTLLSQTSDQGGGPFETQPATVRGNIVNETNSENFAFGYFRLSEVDEFIYIVR